MQRQHPRPQRGLTLIELMIVVLVLGVLIALVAPSLRGMISAQRVRGTNAELVTNLQYARSEAARRNRDVSVAVQASCYVVYTDVALPATACDCTLTPGVDVCSGGRHELKTVQLPASDKVSLSVTSSGGPIVIFSRSAGALQPTVAAASAPTGFAVQVSGTPRGKLRTQLNPSGRPSVCSPDGSISGTATCSP
ncbi:MAG TPA: GspH/FimT family pseudopilin [Rubrivivax sp.]|nr:GspH/FimT family pseudopilin [Rubrivivax sp.]